tara:strand:- start:256 stop:2205 length:1950 start_codon:yes stop_codon:yes gene_type:complete
MWLLGYYEILYRVSSIEYAPIFLSSEIFEKVILMITNEDISKVAADLGTRVLLSTGGYLKELLKKVGDQSRLQMAENLSAYTEQLLQKHCNVKTLFYGDSPRFIYDFFVYQDIGNSKHEFQDVCVRDMLAVGTRFLISGIGGAGKSILMRHLLYDSVKSIDYMPVFIELRDLNSSEASLFDYILYEVAKFGLNIEDPTLDAMLSDGKVMLFLDGFDELKLNIRDSVRKDIIEFADRFPEIRIVVSSRPEEEKTGWHQFMEFGMRPLSVDKIEKLVNFLKMDDTKRSQFLVDIKEKLIVSHESFLSNPLLLTLMAVSYSRNASIPTRRHLFYEQVFDAMWNQHDAMKENFAREKTCGLHKDDFMMLFGGVSLHTYKDSAVSFSPSVAKQAVARSSRLLGIMVDPDLFIGDLVIATCMMIRDGIDLRYTHRSFQEYFTAYFVGKMSVDIRTKIWNELFSRMMFDSVFDLLYEMESASVESEFLIPRLRNMIEEVECSEDPHLAYLKRVVGRVIVQKIVDAESSPERYNISWARTNELTIAEFVIRHANPGWMDKVNENLNKLENLYPVNHVDSESPIHECCRKLFLALEEGDNDVQIVPGATGKCEQEVVAFAARHYPHMFMSYYDAIKSSFDMVNSKHIQFLKGIDSIFS